MKKVLFLLLLLLGGTSFAQTSPGFPITNSNWIATDALSRKISEYKQTGAVKDRKWVGLFYYIWQGGYHLPFDTVYDNSKILKNNPTNPQYGPLHYFHYWGESEAGYYRSDDPWVIRRNIAMMAAAGVDFIYFDVTNAFTYYPTVDKYCEISLEMRSQGINAPYISFMTNARSGEIINKLYDDIYAQQKYKDLWYLWEGKPLIFGQPTDVTLRADVKNFFNIKYSWAWTDAKNQPNQWQWIDSYPQDYGWSVSGVPDQLPVAAASHPTLNIGSSFSNGQQPPLNLYKLTAFTGQGLFFAEQWKQVFVVQPKVVMITQWNEWMAQRFVDGTDASANFLGDPPANGNSYFVDNYNEEYTRDIEPMKGGHTDNMYFQMVNYIRLFKGMVAPKQATPSKKIVIDGVFSEWSTVEPVYTDYKGDTLHRNSKGANINTTYINNTGRNDIIESRVTYDQDFVYFYAKTDRPLTPYNGQNWMLLYLNTDNLKSTGWEGYDILINNNPTSATQTSIKKLESGIWTGELKINYAYAGNEVEIAVPISNFNVVNNKLNFSFHWADNTQKLYDINEFFINGDSAPDRRFDYFFTTENPLAVSNTSINKFKMFPNPAKNILNLTFKTKGKYIVSIYDMTSSLKLEKKITAIDQLIDISTLTKGVYLVEVKTTYGETSVQKLVIN